MTFGAPPWPCMDDLDFVLWIYCRTSLVLLYISFGGTLVSQYFDWDRSENLELDPY